MGELEKLKSRIPGLASYKPFPQQTMDFSFHTPQISHPDLLILLCVRQLERSSGKNTKSPKPQSILVFPGLPLSTSSLGPAVGEVSFRVTHRSHPCVTLWGDYTLLSLQGTFHPNNFHATNYVAFPDEQSDETLVMASLRIPQEYQGSKAPSCSSSPNSGP